MCAQRKGGWTHKQTNGVPYFIITGLHVPHTPQHRVPQSAFIDSDRRGGNLALALALSQTGRNGPKWEKGACQPNAVQLWLLMNATGTLSRKVIGKLSLIARQAEWIHLSLVFEAEITLASRRQ